VFKRLTKTRRTLKTYGTQLTRLFGDMVGLRHRISSVEAMIGRVDQNTQSRVSVVKSDLLNLQMEICHNAVHRNDLKRLVSEALPYSKETIILMAQALNECSNALNRVNSRVMALECANDNDCKCDCETTPELPEPTVHEGKRLIALPTALGNIVVKNPGITKTQLRRDSGFKGSNYEFNNAIQGLIDNRVITMHTIITGGRPRETYYPIQHIDMVA